MGIVPIRFYKTSPALDKQVIKMIEDGKDVYSFCDGSMDFNDTGTGAFLSGFAFAQMAKDQPVYGVDDGDATYFFIGDLKTIKAKLAAVK